MTLFAMPTRTTVAPSDPVTRTLAGVLLAMLLAGCQGDEPTGTSANPPDSTVAVLDIDALPSLIVHEMALFTVKAKTADGRQVPVPTHLTWDASDTTVATVSELGVVTARGRGTVTIGARAGTIRGEVTIRVKARVKITPAWRYRPCGSCYGDRTAFFPPESSGEQSWRLPIGDTLHLRATWVDIDGVPLGGDVAATWTSSDPDHVSVNGDGDVVALAHPSLTGADITASTADGMEQTRVRTSPQVAGLPAMLRLAHAAIGLGPITFLYNKGAPVTLSFGEYVDIPISSGLFFLDTEGLPSPNESEANYRSFGALVQGGDRLAMYAIGGEGISTGAVVGAWDTPTVVPDDSVRVRLVQGFTSAGVVYIVPPGAPANGLPELCYFDPLNVWGYMERPPEGVDFVMQAKYGPQYEPVRIHVSPEPRQSVTYVITQSAAHPLGLVAFPER